ncbi:cellulose binding domain-containing protein [Micromonospora sp. NPDC023737]|uniref:cellulose binding domain-containing protein n=1 Tax=unclassified Micromonospora TaxID=2617518 RepID=UPI0033E9F3C1
MSAAPPAPATVTGRYRVNSTFSGGFIGEVRVSNVSGSAQGWEVRLEFSGGRVTRAWVMNAVQGEPSEDDNPYTYRSGVDLAPGASARLMFVAEGADTHPVACSVNGVTCAGL